MKPICDKRPSEATVLTADLDVAAYLGAAVASAREKSVTPRVVGN